MYKETFVKLFFIVGSTIGIAVGGWIGMWAGLYTWERWHNKQAFPSPPLPSHSPSHPPSPLPSPPPLPAIGELPDILVKKYKFHADVCFINILSPFPPHNLLRRLLIILLKILLHGMVMLLPLRSFTRHHTMMMKIYLRLLSRYVIISNILCTLLYSLLIFLLCVCI